MRCFVFSTSAILLVATTAFAQTPVLPPSERAPLAWQQSMTLVGTVVRFTLTPRGDLDGFILNDGTQVHVPPHLSAELAEALRPGDPVTVHGYRPPTGALLVATSLTTPASNRTVVDRGPPAPGFAPPPPPGAPTPGAQSTIVQGRVQRLLRGPAGDMNGAVLDDGTILRMPPHVAYQVASVLVPGRTVAVQGWGLATSYGRVIDVQSMAGSAAQLDPASLPQPTPIPAAPVPPRPDRIN